MSDLIFLFVQIIWTLKIPDNLPNWKMFGILISFQIINFENLLIFEIKLFQKFDYFMNLSIMETQRFSKL